MQKALKNILIINPFGIGDVLFTTPLIEALSARTEGSGIGFLCNRRTEPLLRANPKIKWVFVYEKDELRALWKRSKAGYFKRFFALAKDIREKKFDAAIDLSLSREYWFLCFLSGIKERIGFDYKNRGSCLTRKITIDGYHDKHVIEYYLGLLRFMGVEPAQKGISLYLSQGDKEWARGFLRTNGIKERELLVGIAPAGGASWGREAAIKHWRSEGFAGVADRLIEERGAKVIIMGSEAEAGICEKTAKAMRNPAVMACGKTTLLQSAALMALCDLVIANDGGPLHLAVAAGARTVGIFGPVDENVYGQYPPSARHKVVKEDIACRPCYRDFRMKECGDRKCISGISAEAVFKAATEALAAR
ncbi:MAG: glycosyltransferase family 9 protein [Candidatus Omnitrophica bacterium]|nr:glycosyltransferase family 9 protein [Candidatus Omnitrophota bacterium]MDD5545947.1 glycosyltransferase family 9 protein [Candidatus Omnitrophota bacterium]